MNTNSFLVFLLSLPALLIATTVHEYTRAMMSISLGDDLPKTQKRNTLNPVKHFEPIGFLLLFYTQGFGWGKPVETSSIRYKDRKRDVLLVAVMPSVANLVVGIVAIFMYSRVGFVIRQPIVSALFVYMALYNIGIAIYNLLPVSPMDCTKALSVLLPSNKYYQYLQQEKMIQMIFLFLVFFGMADVIMLPAKYFVISTIENLFRIF